MSKGQKVQSGVYLRPVSKPTLSFSVCLKLEKVTV